MAVTRIAFNISAGILGVVLQAPAQSLGSIQLGSPTARENPASAYDTSTKSAVRYGRTSGSTILMPTFLARRDYLGLRANYIQVADTNGDGFPDVIASEAGFIQVLLGSRQGTFNAGPNSNTTMSALTFVAADMNGDGNIDLVQPGYSCLPQGGCNVPGVGISMGNGDGTFQFGIFYQINDIGTSYVVVGDFNRDGIPDIATPGNMGVWLLTGKGDGTFNAPVLAAPLPQGAQKIAALDFNGDGNLDLVVTMPQGGTYHKGSGFVVLLGNGNGSFRSPLSFSQPKQPNGLEVGVPYRGGHPGIVLSTDSSSDVFIYAGNGAGGFGGPAQVNLPGAYASIAIADLNGDGFPDLISPAANIALGSPTGFKPPIFYPTAGGYQVISADLRNDGLTDIVTNGAAVSVLLSQGHGRYQDGVWTQVAGGGGYGAKADFNRDGKPDLAVVTETGVSILLGTGNAGSPFIAGPSILVTGAGAPVAGDLNGDGIPDLVVPMNGSPNALLAYIGNGDGTFSLKSTTPTPDSGGWLVLADINHDGKLDFISSGNLLGLGNGDGTFQTPVPFVASPPSTGFSNIAVGDINNDGWPDVVLTSGVPYVNAYTLLNNREGGFTQVPAEYGAFDTQAILFDLNADGNLDLIVCSEESGAASVYLGDGTGQFVSQAFLTHPLNIPGYVMAADLNGDDIPDIGLLQGNSLEIFLGTGGATYATPFSIGIGTAPGAVFVENLHGQLPSAGVPDIVAPDQSGGVMVLINRTK